MFFEEPWHCTTAHDWIRGLRCYDSPVDGLFTFIEDEGSCDMVVAVQERESDVLSVYPNPTSGRITVKTIGSFDWFLYDVQGKVLDFQLNNHEEAILSMDYLPSDVYFFSIKQASKTSTLIIFSH